MPRHEQLQDNRLCLCRPFQRIVNVKSNYVIPRHLLYVLTAESLVC